MANVNLVIDGVSKDVSILDLSAVTRKFREAWKFNGNAVEYDIPTMKGLAIQKLKERAKELIQPTKTYQGENFTLTPDFLAELRDLRNEADLGGLTQVTVYSDDNNPVVVTTTQLNNFLLSIAQDRNNIRSQAQARIDNIRNATTAAEIIAELDAVGV